MPAPSDSIAASHCAGLVEAATAARRAGAGDLAAELERRAVRVAQRRADALDRKASGLRRRAIA